MLRLLMIADDFTGALDTGVQLAAHGIPTQVVVGQADLSACSSTVLVVDTETRHLPAAKAAKAVEELTRSAVENGVGCIYKKTDSALRGNIGAELAALLSALAEVPIRLDLAFTGAVSHSGQIMAVGGVTQKVEGFFKVCSRQKLTGTQGVILPYDNVDHLMLAPNVLKAVDEGKFAVYPVKSIEEALFLLTGMPAGRRRKDGTFTRGSLYEKVDRRLTRLGEYGQNAFRRSEADTFTLTKNISGPSQRGLFIGPTPGWGLTPCAGWLTNRSWLIIQSIQKIHLQALEIRLATLERTMAVSKKEALLQAAKDLFGECGYNETTFEKNCRAGRCGHGPHDASFWQQGEALFGLWPGCAGKLPQKTERGHSQRRKRYGCGVQLLQGLSGLFRGSEHQLACACALLALFGHEDVRRSGHHDRKVCADPSGPYLCPGKGPSRSLHSQGGPCADRHHHCLAHGGREQNACAHTLRAGQLLRRGSELRGARSCSAPQ